MDGSSRIPVPPEIIAKAEELQARGQSAARASATPCPGPTARAFGPQKTSIGDTGISVRSIVSSDWDKLTALNSPLVAFSVNNVASGGAAGFDLAKMARSDQWEACYLFTHPPRECAALLDLGIDKFKAAAQDEIGDAWEDPLVSMVLAVVMTKIKESWDTVVAYASQMEEKGETVFFRDAGAKTTASGGS
jgi:hypothetical protein